MKVIPIILRVTVGGALSNLVLARSEHLYIFNIAHDAIEVKMTNERFFWSDWVLLHLVRLH